MPPGARSGADEGMRRWWANEDNHRGEVAAGPRHWASELSLVTCAVFRMGQTRKGHFHQKEQHVQRHGVTKEPGSLNCLIMIVCLID